MGVGDSFDSHPHVLIFEFLLRLNLEEMEKGRGFAVGGGMDADQVGSSTIIVITVRSPLAARFVAPLCVRSSQPYLGELFHSIAVLGLLAQFQAASSQHITACRAS